MALDYQHVIVATGAHWRGDGVGITNWQPIAGTELNHVFTPETVFADKPLPGPIVVFDDDNFYMGAVIAEKLKLEGHRVTLVTSAAEVSAWTKNTLEQHRIQAHTLELGIDVVTAHNLASVGNGKITISCVYSEKEQSLDANSVVLVTSRTPDDELYLGLTEDPDGLENSGIKSVTVIGDCLCPSTIASAVYEGHRVAQEFDAPPENPDMPFRREEISLEHFEHGKTGYE
jgi:dimethylamine/trimethylamine dehydrogenase